MLLNFEWFVPLLGAFFLCFRDLFQWIGLGAGRLALGFWMKK